MSFNSAFLSPSPPSAREREEAKAIAAYRAYVARRCYWWANLLVISAMVAIALPQLGLGPWVWHVVGGVALVVTVLAIVMMVKGAISNGIVSLVFAWAILPGWVLMAPTIIRVAWESYQVIEKPLRERLWPER